MQRLSFIRHELCVLTVEKLAILHEIGHEKWHGCKKLDEEAETDELRERMTGLKNP